MTAVDSYGQSIALWQMTDAPSIPGAIQALAAGVIPRGVMRFASSSARGATLSAPVEGMVTYLLDVNRIEMYDGSAWITPEPSLSSTTSGLSAGAGFTTVNFYGFRQGRSTTLDIYLTRSGSTITSSGGNIGDIVACTVPAGWRPTHDTITSCWDNGISHGGFVIGTDGIVTLRTSTGSITNGTNLRFHISFLKTT